MTTPTKLLLSVRSTEEARLALAAGADVIDVKEPAHGSLGRSDAKTLAEIAAVVEAHPQTLLTAALGELLDDSPCNSVLPARVQYVKFGLARCASQPDWRERWRTAIAALPAQVRAVAVAYADASAAESPDVFEVLSAGEALGCSILLVDTWTKDGRSLLDHCPLDRLGELIGAAHRRGVQVALAGSLKLADAPELLPLGPDYLAVRGGACRDGRTGTLDAELSAAWAALVRESRAQSSRPSHIAASAGGDARNATL